MLDHNKNARASRLFRRAALTRIECFDRAASYTGPFYFLGITCRIITTVLPVPPSWKDFGAQALQTHLCSVKTDFITFYKSIPIMFCHDMVTTALCQIKLGGYI